MSGAKSLAIVLIFRAMVAFPAVSAPRPPDRGPDRLSRARHLSPPFGKAKLGLRKRHGLRKMTLKLQRPTACRLEMVQDLTSGASQRTGRDQSKLRMNRRADGDPLIYVKFTGSLRPLGSIDGTLLVEFLN